MLKTIIKRLYEEIINQFYIDPETTSTISKKELEDAKSRIAISDGSLAYMAIKRTYNVEEHNDIKRYSIIQNIKYDTNILKYIVVGKPKYYFQYSKYDNNDNLIYDSDEVIINSNSSLKDIINILNDYIKKSVLHLNEKMGTN